MNNSHGLAPSSFTLYWHFVMYTHIYTHTESRIVLPDFSPTSPDSVVFWVRFGKVYFQMSSVCCSGLHSCVSCVACGKSQRIQPAVCVALASKLSVMQKLRVQGRLLHFRTIWPILEKGKADLDVNQHVKQMFYYYYKLL